MVVLRPGDNVALFMSADTDNETVHEVAQGLTKAFKGVEFVVVNGVDSVAVMSDVRNPS